jgi:hypothetical protein
MSFERSLVLVATFAIGSAGCASSSPTSPAGPDLHATVTLAPGVSAAVGGGTSVVFKSVVNDSRCPADAMCVQMGDATIAVDVRSGTASTELVLKTSDSGRTASAGGFTLTLEELTPYPYVGRHPAPEEYRAKIAIASAGAGR